MLTKIYLNGYSMQRILFAYFTRTCGLQQQRFYMTFSKSVITSTSTQRYAIPSYTKNRSKASQRETLTLVFRLHIRQEYSMTHITNFSPESLRFPSRKETLTTFLSCKNFSSSSSYSIQHPQVRI